MPPVDLDVVEGMGSRDKALASTQEALEPFLLEKYDQRAVADRVLGKGQVGEGICVGLSLHWIRQHQNNKKAARFGDKGLLNTEAIVIEARGMQLAYQVKLGQGNANTAAGQMAAMAEACKAVKVAMVGAMDRTGLEEASLATKLRQVHRYHIIAITGFNTGHALAAYMSSGKIFGLARHVYLFDPNIGEFKIPEAETAYALRALKLRYKLIGITNGSCYVCEIKP